MKWALVDQTGNHVGPCGPAGGTSDSIRAQLPTDCHDEFSRMLTDACGHGGRRRMAITEQSGRLMIVDIVPLNNLKTTPIPALVLMYDANEIDRADDHLVKLARRNEAILRCAMDGFFVIDHDCRFLEVNEAFCSMLGYSAAELRRMRITDLEVIDDQNGAAAAHTATGLHQFPTAHRHRLGHTVHLEITVNVLHDNGDKILVGFARDITQRLAYEQELARLTRQHRLILDAAGEGIAGLDAEGRISFTNPAALDLLGATSEAVIGVDVHAVLLALEGPGHEDQPVSAFDDVLQGLRRRVASNTRFKRADGTRFSADFTVNAMLDERGEVIGAVVTFSDCTERERAESERRKLQRQVEMSERLESVGLLAGGLAHDLNNMLTGIQGNAALALEELDGDGIVSRRLERVVSVCQRAGRLIDQVLTSSGRKGTSLSNVALPELLRETIEFLKPTLPSQVELTFDSRVDDLCVEADAGQVQQIFTNLLVNAVEAIGDQQGRIEAHLKPAMLSPAQLAEQFAGQSLVEGEYAMIEVIDNGCGMDARTLAHLFDPFFSQKGAGRGLGLAALRGILQSHRGGVRVDSQLGTGTRITLALPVSQSENANVEPESDPAESGIGQGRQRATLLVIDDDPDVREVLRDMLVHSGYHVLQARDGDSGITVYQEHANEIDVVLLDLMMPGRSGAEVFETLRKLNGHAKIIIVSGYMQSNVAEQFADHPPFGILSKPFDHNRLLELIESASADQPMRSEIG
jgi:two-component system cell cycle sensor histidine kinase/response regulator CckA